MGVIKLEVIWIGTMSTQGRSFMVMGLIGLVIRDIIGTVADVFPKLSPMKARSSDDANALIATGPSIPLPLLDARVASRQFGLVA